MGFRPGLVGGIKWEVDGIFSTAGCRVKNRRPILLLPLLEWIDAVLAFNLRCTRAIVSHVGKPSTGGIVGWGNDSISLSAVRAFIMWTVTVEWLWKVRKNLIRTD